MSHSLAELKSMIKSRVTIPMVLRHLGRDPLACPSCGFEQVLCSASTKATCPGCLGRSRDVFAVHHLATGASFGVAMRHLAQLAGISPQLIERAHTGWIMSGRPELERRPVDWRRDPEALARTAQRWVDAALGLPGAEAEKLMGAMIATIRSARPEAIGSLGESFQPTEAAPTSPPTRSP